MKEIKDAYALLLLSKDHIKKLRDKLNRSEERLQIYEGMMTLFYANQGQNMEAGEPDLVRLIEEALVGSDEEAER